MYAFFFLEFDFLGTCPVSTDRPKSGLFRPSLSLGSHQLQKKHLFSHSEAVRTPLGLISLSLAFSAAKAGTAFSACFAQRPIPRFCRAVYCSILGCSINASSRAFAVF